MMRNLVRAALAAFFWKSFTLVAVAPALAAGPESAAAAARLKAFVEGTRTFRADFTQTLVAGKAGRKPQVSSGQVVLSRPGRFRWQVDKPYPQLMVGDGQKVWLHDPDLNQVTVRRIGEALDGTPAALLAGEKFDSTIERRFTVSEGGSADGIEWVDAVPKGKDASFAKIRLGFRGDVLHAMEMGDNFGQTTSIRFSRVEKNPALAPGLFKFTPPAGADVVGE